MEFRVLGPVEVIRNGDLVVLGRGMLVDLLAALLVPANEVVPADVLVDAVWYAKPPAHPRAALHNGISRLRRVVGGDVIETLPHGYRIRADADHLDLLRFDRLVAAADRAAAVQDAEAALAQGLDLWRGRPLGNVESPVLLNGAAAELTGRYLDVCERWAGLCLRLGRHDAVVARLAAPVRAHPFREQLAGQLMLALYRSGRQAEALAAYDELRRSLSEEMGIDPGAALRELHVKILRADPSLSEGQMSGGEPPEAGAAGPGSAGTGRPGPLSPPPPPVPRQLPPGLPDFCGREAETAELTELVTSEATAPGGSRVVVVSGKGGVGKTALAVQVGHRVSGRFPDGQLFADLGGAGPRAVLPGEVLAGFLRALGVAGPAVPPDAQERIALFRSLVAGRRLLVVLDNAAGESQVRPLLPGSSSCAVIVTGRARMTALAGARVVHLDVLDDTHALELLGRIIGPGRAAAEAADVRELAGLCGGLPLALRIAGARLAAKAHWPVAKLTSRLAGTRRRLTELAHGDLDVRASFALSYHSLDPAAQVMLRRASLLDAPDFPAWAGAALLDAGLGEAEDICERLVDAQLLDPVPAPGPAPGSAQVRYRLHDLVRAFAGELAAGEPAAERAAALGRAFGGWLALAEHAHRQVYGGDYTILHGSAPRWTATGGAVQHAIAANPMGWLEGERPALLAAVRQSAELGLDELCWDLAWTATTLYEARGYFDDWRATVDYALAATEKAGNLRGTAAMLITLASSRIHVNELGGEAWDAAERSLRLFSQLGDLHGCAIAQYRLGFLSSRNGQVESAIRMCGQARLNARQAGDAFIEALLLRELASAHLARDDYQQATDCLAQALRLAEQTGSLRGTAMTLYSLGEVHLRSGDPQSAGNTFRRVLEIVRTDKDIRGEAHALLGLGEALAQAGHHDDAARQLQEALTLGRQTRQRLIEARALLLLGQLAATEPSAQAARNYLTQSLAIFTELGLPHWQQRASAALRNLEEGSHPLTHPSR